MRIRHFATTVSMPLPAVDRPTHRQVLAGLVPLRDRRIVDVGCGAGDLVRWLRSQGAQVVGVECGHVILGMAHDADPGHADDYLEGVGQDLPVADQSVDVVIYSYSLHHVPADEMLNALREAHRVLRTGGTLYVVEPLAAGPGFEVVKLVDDETEVCALAQAALRQAPSLGFVPIADHRYTSRTVVASVDAFAERVVGVDPTRTERLHRHRAEFVERFEALAQRIDEAYVFDQDNQVSVYRTI